MGLGSVHARRERQNTGAEADVDIEVGMRQVLHDSAQGDAREQRTGEDASSRAVVLWNLRPSILK